MTTKRSDMLPITPSDSHFPTINVYIAVCPSGREQEARDKFQRAVGDISCRWVVNDIELGPFAEVLTFTAGLPLATDDHDAHILAPIIKHVKENWKTRFQAVKEVTLLSDNVVYAILGVEKPYNVRLIMY